MIDERTILGVVCGVILMASIHGVLLASIFLFNKRLNSTSNKWLAFSIIGVSIILFYEFLDYLEIESVNIIIDYFPLYSRTSVSTGLLLFVIYLLEPNKKLKGKEKLFFLPVLLELILEFSYIPINIFIADGNQIDLIEYYLTWFLEFLGVLTGLIFVVLSIVKVNNYQKFLLNSYSTISNKSLVWLRTILYPFLIIFVFCAIAFLQDSFDYDYSITYLIAIFGFIILLFWVGYFVVIQYSVFQVVPYSETTPEHLSEEKKLSANTEAYYTKLVKYMEAEHMYRNSELTLQDLADKLDISAGYLSQIINDNDNKNFFEFVNRYRIHDVKNKLRDKEFDHYSIMGIALESGFKSKSTFNTVFKSFTGKTPSSYRKGL